MGAAAGGAAADVARSAARDGSNALVRALTLHNRFEAALEEFEAFQRERGHEVTMWNTVHRLLVTGRSDDGIDPERLYDALGVSEYHEGLGRTWQGDESVEEALHVSAAKLDNLERGQRVTWSERERTGVPFVDVGREIVAKRVLVEVRAHELVEFLRTGDEPDASVDPPAWNIGMDDWEPPEFGPSNGFYRAFVRLSFREQIVYLEALTARLGSCYRGRLFFAQLFEHGDDALLNPFRIVDPRLAWETDDAPERTVEFRQGAAVDAATGAHVSVFVENVATLRRYYTEDFRLKFEFGPHKEGGPVEPHLLQVLLQLLPGLAHFHAYRESDRLYLADPRTPDPTDLVGRFVGTVLARTVTDDDVRGAIDEAEWAETPYADAPPTWDEDRLAELLRGERTWTEEDTTALAKATLGATDKLLSTAKLPEMRLTAPFKLLVAASGGCAGIATLLHPSRADPAEQVQAFTDALKAISDFDVVERYLPSAEVVKELDRRSAKRRALQFGRQVTTQLNRLGTVLEVIGALFDVFDLVAEVKRGNYGSAVGSSLLAIGGIASVTAAIVGGWAAVIVAVATTLVGVAVKAWFTETPSEIIEWLETTAFGREWDELDDPEDREPFLDPTASTYGYRRVVSGPGGPVGEVDYGRQLSELHTLLGPVGVTTAELDRRTPRTGGDNRLVGRVAIAPNVDFSGDVPTLRPGLPVKRTGLLVLRPLPVHEQIGVVHSHNEPVAIRSSFAVSDDASGDWLHRFVLADEVGTGAPRSKTNGGPTDEPLEVLWEPLEAKGAEHHGRWIDRDFNSLGLDLEVTRAETLGSNVVTLWSCRVWEGADGRHADRIVGWPPDEVDHDEADLDAVPKLGDATTLRVRYVELLYVPPELVDAVVRDGTVVVPPEELPTVRRERAKVTVGEDLR